MPGVQKVPPWSRMKEHPDKSARVEKKIKKIIKKILFLSEEHPQKKEWVRLPCPCAHMGIGDAGPTPTHTKVKVQIPLLQSL